MARSTKEEALETRNRLLDAAENVFSERGVSNTSLADVAEAANVTRGAIYWHFKNKSDLFDAMCERVRLPMEEMMEAKAEEPDPLRQLRTTCLFILNEATGNPHTKKVFEILFHKCEFVDPTDPIVIRQQECFAMGTENIKSVLRNAVAKNQLPADLEIDVACAMVHALIDGLLNNWLFAPASVDLPGHAERLIDACLDALRYAPALRGSAKAPAQSQS